MAEREQARTAETRRRPSSASSPSASARTRGEPEIQANLIMALGQAYFRIGLFDEAAPPSRRALDIRRQHFGAEHEAVAESLAALALVDATQGDSRARKTSTSRPWRFAARSTPETTSR